MNTRSLVDTRLGHTERFTGTWRMLTWTGLWLGVVRSHYRSSTHLGVSAVSVVVTCVCLGGWAANATGPSKHRLAACLLFIPLRGLAWFYLELARQLLTYALEPSKLPGIFKWMVEFAVSF